MKTFSESKTYGIFSTAANQKIIKDLEESGAQVFQFAALETEVIEKAENIEVINNNFGQCDWLIFPDVFAVDYFLEILEARGIDLFELDEKRILVLGEAVADRLRFSQIHADIIPNSVKNEDVFRAVTEYLDAEKLLRKRFLLVKFSGFESDLSEKLTSEGAEVFEAEIYRINQKTDAKLKALLLGGAIDAFIFSSPEDVFAFQQTFSFSAIANDLQFFGTNEIAMQTLREYGIISKYFQIKRG